MNLMNKNKDCIIYDQLEMLKVNLNYLFKDLIRKSLVVTSATENEGKSFLASNISATLAKDNDKVLLIDGNFRSPSLHNYFDIKNNYGLFHFLLGTSGHIDEVIFKTSHENLSLIPTGAQLDNPTEKLNVEQIESLIKEVSARYDWIIIDSPSVLPSHPEPLIYGQLTSGLVFVVAENESRIDQIKKATKIIEGLDINVLGTIFNKRR